MRWYTTSERPLRKNMRGLFKTKLNTIVYGIVIDMYGFLHIQDYNDGFPLFYTCVDCWIPLYEMLEEMPIKYNAPSTFFQWIRYMRYEFRSFWLFLID